MHADFLKVETCNLCFQLMMKANWLVRLLFEDAFLFHNLICMHSISECLQVISVQHHVYVSVLQPVQRLCRRHHGEKGEVYIVSVHIQRSQTPAGLLLTQIYPTGRLKR